MTLPPPPSGFSLDDAKSLKPRKGLFRGGGKSTSDKAPPPPEGFVLDAPQATDGDTVRSGDTPTPLQPLAPAVRDGYADLLRSGSAEEINAFLTANGYETSRPDDLRKWVARRDAGENVDYAISQESPPPMMIDLGDGATGAFMRKAGSGSGTC